MLILCFFLILIIFFLSSLFLANKEDELIEEYFENKNKI